MIIITNHARDRINERFSSNQLFIEKLFKKTLKAVQNKKAFRRPSKFSENTFEVRYKGVTYIYSEETVQEADGDIQHQKKLITAYQG